MEPTKITRPKFPKGYVDKPVSFLTWDWVATQLTESKHYWLCSVRPSTVAAPAGRPHVIPRWCVYRGWEDLLRWQPGDTSQPQY